MPFVYNGIGTWYYGKRRIHTIKGSCEFCSKYVDLTSYDTTLFFVVVMVPIIPLGQKRILQQCSSCQRHRVVSRAKWDRAKEKDSSRLLEMLDRDPNDRAAIVEAIGFATSYQDQPLFDSIVERLEADRTEDAVVQSRLGDGYVYFARWQEAEKAYRASLAIDDSESTRELLAWPLLKLGRPGEAAKYLEHILENKKATSAGLIYFLIEGYQAQGMHEEALEVIDRRDEVFPQWSGDKDYKKQRKLSQRYRGSEKRIYSPVLSQGKAGYREGNWTARLPHAIAVLVILGAIFGYIGSAIWIGQARKVYLVNGTSQTYSVVVQGAEYRVPPATALPVRIVEGDVEVAFRDDKIASDPVRAHIETDFWSRPFEGHTFVFNPDQAAIVLEEEVFYAAANPRAAGPPKVHFGQSFYSLPGVDYEFQEFPRTLQVKGQREVQKTRVSLAPASAHELRLGLMLGLGATERLEFCRKLIQIDPGDAAILSWYCHQIPAEEAIHLLESRLDERPILVEWHRAYQSLMERTHPDVDLRPRYRKLLEAAGGSPDAVYLLGRADPDPDEREALYRKAAAATPPSGFALAGLAYRALSDARFDEACRLFDKALPFFSDRTAYERLYFEALLAKGDYDQLLVALQRASNEPGREVWATAQMVRVLGIRGDRPAAMQKMNAMLANGSFADRTENRRDAESILAAAANDVPGYLAAHQLAPSFESAFLHGEFDQAENSIGADDANSISYRGLLYLAAIGSGDRDRAKEHLAALIEELGKLGREEKTFASILKEPKAGSVALAKKQTIDPSSKRILLAVLSQLLPKQSEDILALARKLNYQHDGISLCLAKYLKKR